MIELFNRKTGEKLYCEFNIVSAGDIHSMKAFQSSVQEEYGTKYLRQEVYDMELLAERIKDESIVCFLATSADGDTISTLELSPIDGMDGILEMGTHVVRKKYRGFGVGTVFTKALLALPEAKRCSAVTAHSVTSHPLAQHQTISCGLEPTGFLFSCFSDAAFTPAFDHDNSKKNSVAVGIFSAEKKNAGEIYAPTCHRDFISNIYNRLKVSYTLKNGQEASGKTVYAVKQDDIHHVKTVQVFCSGRDLGEIVEKELLFPQHPEQVVDILLDMNHPTAMEGYEIIKNKGFIFAGIYPLCQNGEFIILHHSLDVDIHFDKFSIDDGYRMIFEYIRDRA